MIIFTSWNNVNYIMRNFNWSALLTQYCPGDKIEKNEMSVACRRMGERRGVYGVLMGKPEWKRPLVRPRRRWEDNIKMELQEVGCGSMDWIELAWHKDRWRAPTSIKFKNFYSPHYCKCLLKLFLATCFNSNYSTSDNCSRNVQNLNKLTNTHANEIISKPTAISLFRTSAARSGGLAVFCVNRYWSWTETRVLL